MKRITAILLCVLLCISFAACGSNSEDIGSSLSLVSTYENDQAETTGNSETDELSNGSTTATDSSVPDNTETDDSKVSETTGNPTDTTEPDTSVSTQTGTPNTPDIRPSGGTTGSNKTDTSKDADTSEETKPSQTTTPPADTSTESKPKDETKPAETTKPTEPPKDTTPPTEESKPEETTKPTETTKPEETNPQEPSDPYAYPFNIEQIRKDCIALGRSYGFTLDESLTPNNSSWAGAETASSNTQGTRLKRLLTEMVEYYSPAYREDMGLPAVNITAFNIYCESTGNGTYRIYFLFLL